MADPDYFLNVLPSLPNSRCCFHGAGVGLGAEGLGQGQEQGELWDLGLSCWKRGILTLRQTPGNTIGIQHLDSPS